MIISQGRFHICLVLELTIQALWWFLKVDRIITDWLTIDCFCIEFTDWPIANKKKIKLDIGATHSRSYNKQNIDK